MATILAFAVVALPMVIAFFLEGCAHLETCSERGMFAAVADVADVVLTDEAYDRKRADIWHLATEIGVDAVTRALDCLISDMSAGNPPATSRRAMRPGTVARALGDARKLRLEMAGGTR